MSDIVSVSHPWPGVEKLFRVFLGIQPLAIGRLRSIPDPLVRAYRLKAAADAADPRNRLFLTQDRLTLSPEYQAMHISAADDGDPVCVITGKQGAWHVSITVDGDHVSCFRDEGIDTPLAPVTSNFTSSMVTYVLQELAMSCDPADSPTAEMLAREGHMVTKVWGPGPYFDVIPDSALPSFYLVDRENLLLQKGDLPFSLITCATLVPSPQARMT